MDAKAEKFVGVLSNSKSVVAVDAGSRVPGGILVSVRETAQPAVKVPKYGLSANTKGSPWSQTAGMWA